MKKKEILKAVKDNLGSAWRKGYHNEEGLDDEEEHLLTVIDVCINEVLWAWECAIHYTDLGKSKLDKKIMENHVEGFLKDHGIKRT